MTDVCLATESLSFGYKNFALLFEDWSYEFEPAATTAITGPSGCGKSTLLYLLGLMLTPSAGSIQLAHQRVDNLSDASRARLRAHCYGFVFQDAALDHSRTIMANVTEAAVYRGQRPSRYREAAMTLLDRFGVELRADHKPGQVSGGQAQRIALCRALLGDPQIVLADEPTGNLDPSSAEVVFSALQQQADSGATVVIVTHDHALAAACNQHLSFSEGD
ncbi:MULTISPECIES: ABC transporter ATP-binding protein [Auritidibacter]|uniref:ATP-binding cassette domain-containing protein n=1 Tax=Auritidibacter ignavus TaxID=678932 RepID=A0AAJ6DCJ4_9MICC|nr:MULTISPECIES: ATP-binding cassette domain-containing protein [Auritidibacter]PXA75295.1 ABC transporter [Auritidibacter sp. NML120779]AXR73102.1 ATP-binding cassette domain-containing protein [Auritidibacter sp. NML130574]NIH71540.1 ABC-type lipoprotein export system ATPase subunit [Auritidibacter ignavus]PXA77375.1 ABC transporter [Auritidibacter sp. NML100628]PXA81856.1 ABC transporter [Auritidibacter sp. NML120636]